MSDLFVGDSITLQATFTNASGALFSPDSVTFKVTTPSGTTTTLSSLSNPSTGVYTKAYVPAAEGDYVWYATGTGANAKSSRGTFKVLNTVP